jgi:hypothetical protein
MRSETKAIRLSRRKMLQLLAALGITGPAAAEIVAQVRSRQLSPEILKTANAITDQQLSEERLAVAAVALQRNLEQFQIVRDLEIDDSVEPAPILNASVRW